MACGLMNIQSLRSGGVTQTTRKLYFSMGEAVAGRASAVTCFTYSWMPGIFSSLVREANTNSFDVCENLVCGPIALINRRCD